MNEKVIICTTARRKHKYRSFKSLWTNNQRCHSSGGSLLTFKLHPYYGTILVVSVTALQLQRHMNNLICGFHACNSSSIKDLRVKKHFCSSTASTSQPGEFMTTWLLSSSPRIYRTPVFPFSVLSSVLQRNNSLWWKTAKSCKRCHTAPHCWGGTVD